MKTNKMRSNETTVDNSYKINVDGITIINICVHNEI